MTGLLLAALPSVAAQAEISELLRGLPSKYCSAEDGRRPVVKSQGGYGTCWALAATSALEASLLPKTHVIFSADHMALNNAFSVTLNDGGDYRMAMAYLAGWQGPVQEEADAYGDAYSPAGLLPVVHVQEMRLYEDDVDKTLIEAGNRAKENHPVSGVSRQKKRGGERRW